MNAEDSFLNYCHSYIAVHFLKIFFITLCYQQLSERGREHATPTMKWRNPNIVDTIIFSTSIYGNSVMFADVTTIDMPIIMLLLSPYECLVLIRKLLILAHDAMFGFCCLQSYMLSCPQSRLNKLLVLYTL